MNSSNSRPARRIFLKTAVMGSGMMLPVAAVTSDAQQYPPEKQQPSQVGNRARTTGPQRNWQEIRGVNYVPSYARNAEEVWTRFDADVVDRELGFAERMGFNTIRFYVNVHAFEEDSLLMMARLDRFLDLSRKHNFRVIPQLFDSCGVEESRLPQRGQWYDPQKGKWFNRHWRMWTSSPGCDRLDPKHWGRLDQYVKQIVGAHLNDDRILIWDVINEPWYGLRERDKERKATIQKFVEHYCKLVKNLNPEAPITIGLTTPVFKQWLKSTNDHANPVVDLVDVIAFHHYQFEVEPRPRQWAAILEQARQYSQRMAKPVVLTEMGYPPFGAQGGKGRSMTDDQQLAFYEQIMPVLEQSKVGWCVFDLIMGYGPFAHVSMLKSNGDKRPAAVVIEKYLKSREAKGVTAK